MIKNPEKNFVYCNNTDPKSIVNSARIVLFYVVILKRCQTNMPDRTRHRIKITDKNENMPRGGPASHIDQGRHSRFTARVLQRPVGPHATAFNIKWSILKQASSYRSGAKSCNLCLQEKLEILKGDKKRLLNRRCELFSKCCHRRQFFGGKFEREHAIPSRK